MAKIVVAKIISISFLDQNRDINLMSEGMLHSCKEGIQKDSRASKGKKLICSIDFVAPTELKLCDV